MDRILSLFSLPPVFRGLIAMALCGATFPLCGIAVLRLELIPLRYMLMHGVILGGAIAMALSLPVTPVAIVADLILVALAISFTSRRGASLGIGSTASMVVSMALATVVMHCADVPAKDTLELLWGSPFALSTLGLASFAVLSLAIVVAATTFRRSILALFFNTEIAQASGLRIVLLRLGLVACVAVAVASAMKLLGAFLVDAALLLPVLCADAVMRRTNRAGICRLAATSCLFGFLLCLLGYIIAVLFNLPPAGSIGLLCAFVYLSIRFVM